MLSDSARKVHTGYVNLLVTCCSNVKQLNGGDGENADEEIREIIIEGGWFG